MLHMTLLKDGKPVEWGRYKVSADDKTLNATESGLEESGGSGSSDRNLSGISGKIC